MENRKPLPVEELSRETMIEGLIEVGKLHPFGNHDHLNDDALRKMVAEEREIILSSTKIFDPIDTSYATCIDEHGKRVDLRAR